MKIVTISREYGAGGRDIGLAVAKGLGVELYDRDIIRQTAKESGLDYDYLSMESELLSKRENFIRSITPMQYDQKDALFDIQKDIILRLASQGPCVMLGRCADAILTEAGYDCFKVFLHADMAFRAINAGKFLGSDDPKFVQRTMKKIDAARISHYQRYTEQHWGDYKNYDLMIDTSSIGLDETVKLIIDAAKVSD